MEIITLITEQKAFVPYCFTSTETVRTIRNGEPRTSASTFTQLQSSDASKASTKKILSRKYRSRAVPKTT